MVCIRIEKKRSGVGKSFLFVCGARGLRGIFVCIVEYKIIFGNGHRGDRLLYNTYPQYYDDWI